MSYVFHYLVHIIMAYLDDLTEHSNICQYHLHDIRIIFEQCRKFNIRLNPLKCIFCVPANHLLGFIVCM